MEKRNKINGNLGLAIKIAAILMLFGAAYNSLRKMEPEVAKNTEHRIKFEEKITTMEKNIAEILSEVRKE